MQRRFIATLLAALTLSVSGISAAEIQGSFVGYNETKKIITVDVQGTSSDYALSDETKVVTQMGHPTKHGIKAFGNPRIAKQGALLTIITAKRDGKDVVTEIKLGGRLK